MSNPVKRPSPPPNRIFGPSMFQQKPPPNETIGGVSKFESNLWFAGFVLAVIAFIFASALGFGHK